MAIPASISRLAAYYKRHGFGATLRRFSLQAKRTFFANRMVLFYCDLATLAPATTEMPSRLKVERHRTQADIDPHDLQAITSFWNPDLASHNINHRFALGASLWLIRFEDKLAGYGWTLQGRTVEPHYFHLGPDDVHLFDFQVFPEYRGRGLNPLLVKYILGSLNAESTGRAFIEAAEWNLPQRASLRNTAFRYLGLASKFKLLRRTVVCWSENDTLNQLQKGDTKNTPMALPHGNEPKSRLASLKH
jgi:ribosomal protein S18 acetylase RimI-like enzyme